MNKKVITKDNLCLISQKLKSEGKKIVTTNGSYDLFHCGHIMSLEFSKSLGDILIVGVNSDSSVKSYKGDNRPIIPENERLYILSALECVDYVCLFDEVEIGKPLIELVKPHIHTTSSEWGENCPERKYIDLYDVKLVLIPRIIEISTTDIIKRILECIDSDSQFKSKTLDEKRAALV